MAIIKGTDAAGVIPLDFRDVDAQASEILAEAKRAAAAVLEAGRREAAVLVRQAEAERAAAEARGLAEGRERGLVTGRAEGAAAALAEERQRLAPATEAVESALRALRAALDDAARRATADAESSVLRLALDIAGIVVRREVALDSGLVHASVARAVALAPRRSGLEIRVHPADHAEVERFLPSLASRLEGLGVTAIAADESVSRGGCRVRLTDGQVDATLDTQLAEIRRALLGDPA